MFERPIDLKELKLFWNASEDCMNCTSTDLAQTIITKLLLFLRPVFSPPIALVHAPLLPLGTLLLKAPLWWQKCPRNVQRGKEIRPSCLNVPSILRNSNYFEMLVKTAWTVLQPILLKLSSPSFFCFFGLFFLLQLRWFMLHFFRWVPSCWRRRLGDRSVLGMSKEAKRSAQHVWTSHQS